MDKTRTSVRIAGQELRISGSESEDYIRHVASYVDEKVCEVQRMYPNLSVTNCILLASMNIADDYHKLKSDYEALDSRIAELRDMPRTAPASPVKRPFANKEPVKTK